MKDYLVIYEQAEDGGWGAHSPDVEGVFAVGSTRAEAESRITEALAAHLSELAAQGKAIPQPRTAAGHVAA
jgi:predicted RNase H-like HicB family nuclease